MSILPLSMSLFVGMGGFGPAHTSSPIGLEWADALLGKCVGLLAAQHGCLSDGWAQSSVSPNTWSLLRDLDLAR